MQIMPNSVEINKTHPNENKQRLYKACYSKGSSQHHTCVWQTPRQAGEWKKLGSKDRKALGMHSPELVVRGSWRRVN